MAPDDFWPDDFRPDDFRPDDFRPDDPVGVDAVPPFGADGPAERRRLGRRAAVARAVARAERGGRVSLCRYDDGCVALAVAGQTGPAEVRTLRGLTDRLAREAWAELVVDLSRLEGDCGPALVRAVGHLRMRRLTAGARVEVHGAPGAFDGEQFTVS